MVERLTNFTLFFPLLTANVGLSEKFDIFIEEFKRIYNISCPIKTKEISCNKILKPWINKDLIIKIKRKHYLFKRYKDGAIDFPIYNEFKNKLSKEIQISKQNYYIRLYDDCKTDCKKTWNVTNNLLNNKSKTPNSYSIVH